MKLPHAETRAPGKMIISGEHAVVHGAPALVWAVNRYAKTKIDKTNQPGLSFLLQNTAPETAKTVSSSLPAEPTQLSPNELRALYDNARDRYAAFLRKQCDITRVLQHKSDIVPFAVAVSLDTAGLLKDFSFGIQTRVQIDIPLGCGMGSSAAVTLSVLAATDRILNHRRERAEYFTAALRGESLIHGHPSGVDPCISLHGGCIRFCRGETQCLSLPPPPLVTLFTGIPDCTTGECVEQVRQQKRPAGFWTPFHRLVDTMTTAWRNENSTGFAAAMRENHQLLCALGVVPKSVQNFVNELEKMGGAAKISGAGAVRGDAAGLVLAMPHPNLDALCARYHYRILSVTRDDHGLQMD